MFSHFLLFHIPVGLLLIFRVPSSVQQQLLPCEDNYNNNNNNSKINAVNNNNNKILGTQSKSAAFQDSLGGVGPLVYIIRCTNSLAEGMLYVNVSSVNCIRTSQGATKQRTHRQTYINIYKRNNWRASRALFFLIGLRQEKVLHADPC